MLRRCLLEPIAEFEIAADALAAAANSLLAGDVLGTSSHLRSADLQALREYSYRVCGPISFEIHRQRNYPQYPKQDSATGARMPSKSVERQIFLRDGYRCRFCNSRVITKEARDKFRTECPQAARWGRTNDEKHFGLATLTATIDHVTPFRRGGTNAPDNLVTACGPCQFGRGHWTLDEVQLEDPRLRPPIIGDWDGLTRLTGMNSCTAKHADA